MLRHPENAAMTKTKIRKNRVRELREAAGMTVADLAEKVKISQPYLTRIEGLKRGLSVALAERIAAALKRKTPEVLGLDGTNPVGTPFVGMNEDAEPYVPQPNDLLADFVSKRRNVSLYRLKTNVLDLMDLHAGDIVFLDISAEAVENVAPMQAVLAQVYDPGDLLKGHTILRQFIPPSLLITNSSGKNQVPLNLQSDPVVIQGVIVDLHRSMRK